MTNYQSDEELFLVLIVNNTWKPELTDHEVYDVARRAWKVAVYRLPQITKIFAVAHRIVQAVYEPTDWHESDEEPGKRVFDGIPADDSSHWLGLSTSGLFKPGAVGGFKYVRPESLEEHRLAQVGAQVVRAYGDPVPIEVLPQGNGLMFTRRLAPGRTIGWRHCGGELHLLAGIDDARSAERGQTAAEWRERIAEAELLEWFDPTPARDALAVGPGTAGGRGWRHEAPNLLFRAYDVTPAASLDLIATALAKLTTAAMQWRTKSHRAQPLPDLSNRARTTRETFVPEYVTARIMAPIPQGSSVVPGSTPVVVFGDLRTAQVATLGLNPSNREFTSKSGAWLVGSQRRLATWDSLGISDPSQMTGHHVAQVLTECYEYFYNNPFWPFFSHLNKLMASIGTSYADGTACHLDLVQWATDPVYGKLTASARNKLVQADAEFLRRQLANENIRVVLINGKTTNMELMSAGFELHQVEPVTTAAPEGTLKAQLFVGALGKTLLIGWSPFFPTTPVRMALRSALATRIAEEVSKAGIALDIGAATPEGAT